MAEGRANSISGSLPGSAGTGNAGLDFPPDSWFHPNLHPVLRDGLKVVYSVFGINTSTLYLEYTASRISSGAIWARGEAYEALLTALIMAAQAREREIQDERATISSDNPLLTNDRDARVREAQTVLNPIFSPQTLGQPSAPGNSLETYVSGGVEPLKQETQNVDAFQKALSGRNEAMERYRLATEEVDQLVNSAHSEPNSTLPGTVMHNPLAQPPVKQMHAAAAPVNEGEHDNVSVASQEVDELKALRIFNDQERAKASQRRDVIDKSIRFQPGLTYLHDFIDVTSGLLLSKQFLNEKEKAQLLVHMLDKTVIDKLAGDSRIINPSSPAQIYELLRNTYPINQQQLSTDLAGITQAARADAVPFIDSIKARYIMHGVPLPSMHSQYMTMHLKFNARFNQHMQNYDNQVTFDRQKNKLPTGDYEFTWEDFSRQATQFDQQQALQRTSREATALADTPLIRGRTRSASTSRVQAMQAEGRYQ